jgi:hypothetical protein
MRLDRNGTLAGRPTKEVRDGLRRLRRGYWTRAEIIRYYPEQHRDDWLREEEPTDDPTDALLAAGLIEPDKERPGQFQVTDQGIRVSCAHLLRPISRAKADAILAAFLDRVAAANANADFCKGVAEVYAYGSYITDADPIGDIDLVVTLCGKTPWPEHYERWKKRVGYRQGNPANPWPEHEVKRFLKARNPHLHLDWEPWSDRDDPPNWPRQRIWPEE